MLPHQVSQGVGVVKAGVAGGCNDLCQVVGRQAEVGDILKGAVCVLDVHPVVLQHPLEGPLHPSLERAFGTCEADGHADIAQTMRQAAGDLHE